MATVAILPVKSFRDAKQRLDPSLEPGPRRLLAEAMYADVLVALRRSRSIDRIVVVSTDHRAQSIAGAYGASLLSEDDRGHNYAAARGIRQALDEAIERVLLVPGDCPALDPAQVDELIARPIAAPSALIVPDRHGTGTNALLLTPPDALAPSLGPGSCERWTSPLPTTWSSCAQCLPARTGVPLIRAGCCGGWPAEATDAHGRGPRRPARDPFR